MAHDLEKSWLTQSLDSLWRRDTSGFGSGLSRAIASRLDVDVVIVRVAFVVMAFCSGLGVALYAWGTVLTPGPQGQRPVDSLLPSMRSWSNGTQLAVVGISTTVFVATVGALTSLPWGLAILAVGLLGWWLMRNRGTLAQEGEVGVAENLDDEALIEQWRRVMGAATHTSTPIPSPLPVVDLYSPDPLPEPVRPPAKSAWLSGLFITLAAWAAGLLSVLLLGLSPVTGIAIGSGVLGLAAVLFALVARDRRLPRSFLGLMLVPIVACGWLATAASTTVDGEPGTHVVKYFAESGSVDLREVDLTGIEHVEIIAVGSEVDVILPGTPVDGIDVDQAFSEVVITGDASLDWPDVSVNVDAMASKVNIVEATRE